MQGIQAWARANPARLAELLNQNPSYVFFRELPPAAADPGDGPIGALGVPLTAERSIAVDPRFVPLGAPVYLATTRPNSARRFERLALAQDTGGAIRGAVRADFFWGTGPEAGALAGRMRQQGRMWVLLPKEMPARRRERAMAARLLAARLLEFLRHLGGGRGHQAGDALAVGEDERRRAVDPVLAAEGEFFSSGVSQLALGAAGSTSFSISSIHALAAVRRAPDRLRYRGRVGRDDRHQEDVHRHVVELRQLLIEPAAVGTARIGEVGELPRALAAHDLERLRERQIGEPDRVQPAHPRLGDVGLRLVVEDVADEEVVARLVV